MTEPAAEEKPAEQKLPEISFKEFLETSPALHPVKATGLFKYDGRSCDLLAPVLTLLCEHEKCQGPRFFAYRDKTGDLYNTDDGERNEVFLEYLCRNCKSTLKSFSFLTFKLYQDGSGEIVKLGEWPPFGPKTPSREILSNVVDEGFSSVSFGTVNMPPPAAGSRP